MLAYWWNSNLPAVSVSLVSSSSSSGKECLEKLRLQDYHVGFQQKGRATMLKNLGLALVPVGCFDFPWKLPGNSS